MSSTPMLPSQENKPMAHKGQGTNVYIWDMDETLILLKSLLNGTYAEAFNGQKDVKKGVDIGEMWEKYILQICDDLFFYEQIEDYNEPFLDSLSRYDDGRDLSDYDFKKDELNAPGDDSNKRKLAYRHRVVAHKYKQGLNKSINEEMKNVLGLLYDMTDEYTDKWFSSARAFLEQCSGGTKDSIDLTDDAESRFPHINILVTSGALIPSLAKCLLFQLDNFISHENVYSSHDVGKLQCFQWIRERFNSPSDRFCVIGDGWEECAAAETMQWPFVKIDPLPSGSHRFPGLTPKTVGYYFAVIYGNPESNNGKE